MGMLLIIFEQSVLDEGVLELSVARTTTGVMGIIAAGDLV